MEDERSPVWRFLVPPSAAGPTAVSARGTRITFADGREALCATSGLWNVNLGYGNEAVARAVYESLVDSSYLTLFRYEHEPAVAAAQALLDAAGLGLDRVVFSTSGGAANDVVMKIARQYALLRGEPERRLVVGLWPSYHGTTFGSAALTGEEMLQRVYGVDRGLVRHLPHNDTATLERFLIRHGERVAAVVVEPLAGTGALPLSDDYLVALLRLRDEIGFLLCADEVATGFHRTGPMFASQTWSGAPDLLIASKGLTNGACAAAAILVGRHVSAVFDAADAALLHGETQAGTPPTCAAILATVSEIDRLCVRELADKLSHRLDDALDGLVAAYPVTARHTGAGCFRALVLAWPDGSAFGPDDVRRAVAILRDCGVVVHPGPGCIQIIPALTYDDDDLALMVERIGAGLRRLV